MNKIKYIGLDISTSIVGICFLDKDQNLILASALSLKKYTCLFEKSKVFKDFLSDLYKNYFFEEGVLISIEESFQSFSKGFSSANTLSKLNRFNGIISYITSEIFSVIPTYINVNTARKNLQIKIDKKSNKNTKDQVFEWVKEDFRKNNIEFNWPVKTLMSGSNKGVVKFDESCYDISDAYVICKALIYNESEKYL